MVPGTHTLDKISASEPTACVAVWTHTGEEIYGSYGLCVQTQYGWDFDPGRHHKKDVSSKILNICLH